ncbi:MAG: DEAD/DEAH box helicase [Chloroflexi bacterium]|nr:DEAD/DEAH box helicase [Chloroflexota bacterium]
MTNDLTFFTNKPGAALQDRFAATLAHVQYFDVLVGYFRTSGFHLLAEALADVEKIRILVGLSVDRQAFEIIDTFQTEARQLELGLLTAKQTKDVFADHVADELAHSPDSYETETGVRQFIAWLQSGKLKIKAHPSQNIHAKVYIQRFSAGFMDYGRVITGSSNFSFSGLKGQYEFNVELKESHDVKYALGKFEELWAEAVDLSAQYIATVNQRTWLNDQIQPYELYLKFLYEYFKEEINADEDFDPYLPDGFMDLAYQRQAVVSAKRILDSYNGVFLADVVGLGKTFIAALLAQQLDKGSILIICPPVLKEYWEETFRDFRVPAVVESLGKLHHIIERGHAKYRYVIIDEAHRFRNEKTQQYEKLHQICWGKKVILVSATPLNNRIDDIYAQLKLFQSPKNSLIPGVKNLDAFFRGLKKRLAQYKDKSDPDYIREVKEVAREVRVKILNQVMVRRTRSEIVKYYAEDMNNRGLFFPEIADPQRITYRFDPATEIAFTKTIELLKSFHYARYMPRLFLKEQLSAFEAQSQRNVGGFMKGLLVKRLESSFYAFRKTLERFIISYDRFIQMLDEGTVYISKTVDVYDLMERDDEAEMERLLDEGELDIFTAEDFAPGFRQALLADRALLEQVQALWQQVERDPKREEFGRQLRENPLLQDQKLIVFTESAETAAYLYEELNGVFPGEVMYFTSGGGKYNGERLYKEMGRYLIEANYDPRAAKQADSVRILITTDVLAEGINLHRSHIVINYDLPWNPTRVLQRVGRVNRVGTSHPQIDIFNFFPTSQSDEHLGLEGNIIAKIQAFHDMLGEDARYLSEDEEVTQHDLRGQVLYRTLTSKETYSGAEAEEGESDLAYLQVIRRVRDEDPALFARLKRLPRKARSGWELTRLVQSSSPRLVQSSRLNQSTGQQLVTFFRLGRLKKFFVAVGDGAEEVDFFTAVDLMQCEPDTKRQTILPLYYELLAENKAAFAAALTEEQAPRPVGGGHTNTTRVLRTIRAAQKDNRKMTDEDEAYLRAARRAFADGRIPSAASKRIMQKVKKMGSKLNGRRILAILRAELNDNILFTPAAGETPSGKGQKEIVLSAYLTNNP